MATAKLTKKGGIEKYLVNYAESSDYAYFYIEDTGRININSCWGNWTYHWTSPGMGFKQFLCGLELGYLAGKLKEDSWLDEAATVKRWKDYAKEQLRDGEIDISLYRKIIREIEQIAKNSTVQSFKQDAFNSSSLFSLYGGAIEFVYDISPTFRYFFENAWKPFTGLLKQETNVKKVHQEDSIEMLKDIIGEDFSGDGYTFVLSDITDKNSISLRLAITDLTSEAAWNLFELFSTENKLKRNSLKTLIQVFNPKGKEIEIEALPNVNTKYI